MQTSAPVFAAYAVYVEAVGGGWVELRMFGGEQTVADVPGVGMKPIYWTEKRLDVICGEQDVLHAGEPDYKDICTMRLARVIGDAGLSAAQRAAITEQFAASVKAGL